MSKLLILTVCYGNIHRSVVAERSLQQALDVHELSHQVSVMSRGLQGFRNEPLPKGRNIVDYPEVWASVQPVAIELGLDLCHHRARPLDEDIVARASLILAMDTRVMWEHPLSITKVFPQYAYKALLYSELAGVAESMTDAFEDRSTSIIEFTRRIHEIAHCHIHRAVELARALNRSKSAQS